MKTRKFLGWCAQFEFKLADFWIGIFWKRRGNCVDLWLCLLPCVPLNVSWWWTQTPEEIAACNLRGGDLP